MAEEWGCCAHLHSDQQDRLHYYEEARSTRFTHLSHWIMQVTANYFVIAKLSFIHELANLIAKTKNTFHIRKNSLTQLNQQNRGR